MGTANRQLVADTIKDRNIADGGDNRTLLIAYLAEFSDSQQKFYWTYQETRNINLAAQEHLSKDVADANSKGHRLLANPVMRAALQLHSQMLLEEVLGDNATSLWFTKLAQMALNPLEHRDLRKTAMMCVNAAILSQSDNSTSSATFLGNKTSKTLADVEADMTSMSDLELATLIENAEQETEHDTEVIPPPPPSDTPSGPQVLNG